MIILPHLYSQIQQFKKPSNSWDLDHKKLLAVFQFEELTEQERSASIPIMNPLGSNNKHLSKNFEPLLAKTPDHHHQLPIPWSITAIRFVNLSRPKKTVQFRTPQDKNISAPHMNYSLSYEIMFPQQKDQCEECHSQVNSIQLGREVLRSTVAHLNKNLCARPPWWPVTPSFVSGST